MLQSGSGHLRTSVSSTGQKSAVVPLRAWLALGIVILLYMLAAADRQILSLLVEPMKRDLRLTDAEIGLLQGMAFSLTYCIVGLPIGTMVDRLPRRLIIFFGVLFWSAAATLSGFARGFHQLLFARAGVGAGEATLTPSSFSLISDLFPRERLATALGIYTCGSNIGSGMAYLFGGLMIGALTVTPIVVLPLFGAMASWQSVLVCVGLPGLILAFLALLLAEPTRKTVTGCTESVGTRPFLRTMRSRWRVLLPHFFGFPLFGLVYYTIYGWLPAWSEREFGWGAATVGPMLGFTNGVLGVGTSLLGGFICDHFYRRGVKGAHFLVPVITCTIGSMIAVIGLVGGASPVVAFWTVAIGAVIQSAFGGASYSAIQLVMPAHMRGRTSATYIFLVNIIGFGLGPVIVGGLTDMFGNPEDLGKAMALVIVVSTGVGAILLLGGRNALDAALTQQAEADAATIAGHSSQALA